MNARDKMPFEITPVLFRLQRYDVAKVQPPAPAGTNDAAAQPPTAQQQ